MTTNNIERELSRSNELRDDDLEQVVGGRANFDDIKIVKHVDKATT